jgi:hypothetical protein
MTDQYADTIAYVMEATAELGGASASLSGALPPAHGYMVAEEGCEEVVDTLTAEVLGEYVSTFADLLADDRHYLGTWVDHGRTYVDVSEWVDDERLALGLARGRRQLAIYSLADSSSIHLTASPIRETL